MGLISPVFAGRFFTTSTTWEANIYKLYDLWIVWPWNIYLKFEAMSHDVSGEKRTVQIASCHLDTSSSIKLVLGCSPRYFTDFFCCCCLVKGLSTWVFQEQNINVCYLQSRLNYPYANNFCCVCYPSLPLSFCQAEFSRPIFPTADWDILRKVTVVSAWASTNHN